MSSNAEVYDFHDAASMLAIANDPAKVPKAATKPLYVEDEDGELATWDGDSLRELADYQTVYNPNNGQIFDLVTDEYVPIQAPEFIGPLAAEIKERDRSIEGTYSMFDGGRGYLEVIFSDSGIWPRDRDEHQEPVRSGVTVSWSHDGGVSVKARGFAQDGACSNTMRRVSDSVYVKHAGDVESRVDWNDEWATVLDQLGAFSEALERVINGAFEYELFDLSDGPFSEDWLAVTDGLKKLSDLDVPLGIPEEAREGINGFFDLLGFPGYISYHATSRLFWRLTQKEDDHALVSAWDAYSAVTYALSHHAQFESGSSSDDDYHRIASDLLANPRLVEQDAGQEFQSRLAPEREEDGIGIEENAGDAMRAFKEREDELRGAFND